MKTSKIKRLLRLTDKMWREFRAMSNVHGPVHPRTRLAFENYRMFRNMLDRQRV